MPETEDDAAILLRGAQRYLESKKVSLVPPPASPNQRSLGKKIFRGLAAAGVGLAGLSAIAPPAFEAAKATIATPSPEKKINLFNELVKPLVDQATRKREEKKKNDPEFAQRIDWDLNRDRVNIVLFGHGVSHEPPHDLDIIGSPTVLSLNLKDNSIDIVSLTHDLRAPEVEEYLKKQGRYEGPAKIDKAYLKGNFDVLARTMENATGLTADFQIALEDTGIKYLVDDVLQGVTVDVPKDFVANQFTLENRGYPERPFSKGPQKLDGLQTMQYMKALVKGTYDKDLERNLRKSQVFKALMTSLENQIKDPTLVLRLAGYLFQEALIRKNAAIDFELPRIAQELARQGLSQIPNIRSLDPKFGFKFGKSAYVVDIASGDGGVTWVGSSVSPKVVSEKDQGLYKDMNMAVPSGDIDPDSKNLAQDYWGSVRKTVKDKLTS